MYFGVTNLKLPMKYILFLFCLVEFSTVFSTESPVAQKPRTLHEQFNGLKTDVEIVNGYRMIKVYTLDQFWKIVEDSMRIQKAAKNILLIQVSNLKKDIQEFKASLEKSEKSKEELIAGVDNLIVFGKPFSKAGFISVVSIMLLGLVVLSGILFSIGQVSLYTARELRKLNESLYEEFDTYKRKTVEKEIKLSRELQNYRNKLAELKMV